MFRGLWRLVWLETKIFVREPLGVFATVGAPVLIYLLVGRIAETSPLRRSASLPRLMSTDLLVLVAVFIAVNAVLSLIAIMAIYRESGILKRLRATPLRPHTILLAHVLVKLLFSAVTIAAMVLAGRRYYPVGAEPPLVAFGVAVLFCILCISSIGFVIASLVPTSRFAQPIGALVLYPMVGLSGLFFPPELLPNALQTLSRVLPLTPAVSLLRGIWAGESWTMHGPEVAALAAVFVASAALSSLVFRWE